MSFSRFTAPTAISPAARLASVLLLALAFSSCATRGPQRDEAQLREHIWKGDFEEAVTLANELRDANPDDSAVRELYDISYEGYYLDKGRSSTLADADLEALAWFKKAEEVSPDSYRVMWWQEKTKDKLADRHLNLGNEAYTQQNYEEAADAYRLILSLMPEHEGAREALAQVVRVMEYREDLGKDYYSDGVRSYADYRLRAAAREFTVTTKYLPGLQRANNRAEDADELIAVERTSVAAGFEEQGLYAAAYNEYRFALELDATNEEAKAGAQRLKGEAQAARYLRDARMFIYRHNFERAIELLDKGLQLTESQTADFEQARASITDARLEASYQKAWNFEHDGSYVLAIGTYGELLEATDYYKDAKARKTTLEGYVEMAAAYYQKAMDADDPELKLEHLRSIEGFWPGYKNIEKLIDRLEQ